MHLDQITMVVPTRNRPQFLRRLLHYYQNNAYRFPLVIADTSDAEPRRENEQTIRATRAELAIDLVHPTGDFVTQCCTALARVRTPYVVFCADDDFIVPSSLPPCLELLNAHPDYSAVQGSTIVIQIEPTQKLWLSAGYDIMNATAEERFEKLSHHGTFPVFYSVYRTNEIRHGFELADEHTDWATAHAIPELLLIYLTAVMGKVRCIADLQGLRQVHALNIGATAPAISDQADVVGQYRGVRHCLASEISQRSARLSMHDAEDLVDSRIGDLQQGLQAWKKGRRTNVARRILKHTLHKLQRQTGPAEGRTSNMLFRKARGNDPQVASPDFQELQQLMKTWPWGIPLTSDTSATEVRSSPHASRAA